MMIKTGQCIKKNDKKQLIMMGHIKRKIARERSKN